MTSWYSCHFLLSFQIYNHQSYKSKSPSVEQWPPRWTRWPASPSILCIAKAIPSRYQNLWRWHTSWSPACVSACVVLFEDTSAELQGDDCSWGQPSRRSRCSEGWTRAFQVGDDHIVHIELVPSLVLVEVESTSQVDSHSFQSILQAWSGQLRLGTTEKLPDQRLLSIDRLRHDLVELIVDKVQGVHHRLTDSKR